MVCVMLKRAGRRVPSPRRTWRVITGSASLIVGAGTAGCVLLAEEDAFCCDGEVWVGTLPTAVMSGVGLPSR